MQEKKTEININKYDEMTDSGQVIATHSSEGIHNVVCYVFILEVYVTYLALYFRFIQNIYYLFIFT